MSGIFLHRQRNMTDISNEDLLKRIYLRQQWEQAFRQLIHNLQPMMVKIGKKHLSKVPIYDTDDYRQRALVKKTDFNEDVQSRCDCRIVREIEAQRAVVCGDGVQHAAKQARGTGGVAARFFALSDTSSSVMNNAQARLIFSPFAP